MANTAPMGRIAPAPKPSTGNTPHLDPVALHGEAINACAMATYYTRRGNHAGAARKAVLEYGIAANEVDMPAFIKAAEPLLAEYRSKPEIEALYRRIRDLA